MERLSFPQGSTKLNGVKFYGSRNPDEVGFTGEPTACDEGELAWVKKEDVLDDSFSALDFKTDSILRKALKEYTKDATTVIVAQRISTILHADQIIVLDEGKMAGIGTHKELMENCEVYRQIAMSQLSEEELA